MAIYIIRYIDERKRMPRPKGQSTGRDRLIKAAARTFRTSGFSGAGVDSVANTAGLTSGAFYAHFGSKAGAFRLVIADGLRLLREGIEEYQAKHGEGWVDPFVDFYLGARLEADLAEACALPTFTIDTSRADAETQTVYQEHLFEIVQLIAASFTGHDAVQRAWSLLAILTGGASIVRAIPDQAMKSDIVAALKTAAKAI